MNPEIKASWVEALRSEEYKQGANALHRNGTFCCLGVLCDLAEKAGVVTSEIVETIVYYRSVKDTQDSNGYLLPQAVREWAELSSVTPSVGSEELCVLNDNGASFKHIADLIEEKL
jgi:hypothetical protein